MVPIPFTVNPTQSTSPSYDLSSSAVDIQGVPIPAEVDCHTLRAPQFTVGDLYGKKSPRTTVEMLPEDILLDIFDFYRLNDMRWGRTWKWHRLAHVCRKWRHLVTVSPRRLRLQIVCGPEGAPIEPILDAWPTLPLSVLYHGGRSLSENIIVTLHRPDRVYKIDLALSSSLIGSIVPMIQKPFPKLKSIEIKARDTGGPATPLAFQGSLLGGSAPRLRDIYLDRVAIPFPAIRQVLSSTNRLVRLELFNIPHGVHFSAVDLVNALSTLIHLKLLTIRFRSRASLSPPPPPPSITTGRPRSTKRTTTLPSLTELDFLGAHKYLEGFISQIDLPSLRKITIRLFHQFVFEIPHLCQLISHLRALGSPFWIWITPTSNGVEVDFRHMVTSKKICSLATWCLKLDLKLSFVTQLMTQLSPFFRSNVHILIIGATPNGRPYNPIGLENVDSAQWLGLFQLFRSVSAVDIQESELVPGIARALVSREEEEADEDVVAAGVFPGLKELFLEGYDKSPSVLEDVERFVSARRRAGHTIDLRG